MIDSSAGSQPRFRCCCGAWLHLAGKPCTPRADFVGSTHHDTPQFTKPTARTYNCDRNDYNCN
eukprot:3596799-Amphidinium_carterae.1